MTTEQEIEAIQIEQELRRRKRDGATSIPVSDTKVAAPVEPAVVDDNADLRKRWAEGGIVERLKLISEHGPSVAAKEAKRLGNSATNLAIEGGAPAVGQALGGMTGPLAPVAVPLLGAAFGAGGNAIAQARGDEPFSMGQVAGAAVSGAIPGASLAGAEGRQVLREGAKYAASNLGSKVLETEIDRGELPTIGEAATSVATGAVGAKLSADLAKVPLRKLTQEKQMMAMRDDTFKSLRKEGVVIPPHEIGEGSDVLSSIGGKAALSQQASRKNAPAWQKLAREEIGLSKEPLPISRQDLTDLRSEYAKPYQELQTIHEEAKTQLEQRLAELAKMPDPKEALIAADAPAMKESLSILSKWADADVNALKEARFSAQKAYDAFKAGNPAAYDQWQAAKATATKLEQNIEDAAASLHDDTLLSRLKESRKKIAQTYSVEEALNPATGLVDPAMFGRQLDAKEPLSGNLKKIAEFQLAFHRNAVEATRAPYPNVGNVGAMAATSQISRGNVPGAIGGIVSATAGRPARAFLLSDYIQDELANPSVRQNFSSALARYASQYAPNARRNYVEAPTEDESQSAFVP